MSNRPTEIQSNGFQELGKDINIAMRGKEVDAKKRVVKLFEAIYESLDITPETLRGESRKSPVREVRHIVMYTLKEWMGLSLKDSAFILGRANHSTAIHSIQAHKDLMDTDSSHRYLFNTIMHKYSEYSVPPAPYSTKNGKNRRLQLEAKIDETVRALKEIKAELLMI